MLQPAGGHGHCRRPTRSVEVNVPATVGFLPHRQARARCPPCFENLRIGPTLRTDPLQKIQHQRVYRIGHTTLRSNSAYRHCNDLLTPFPPHHDCQHCGDQTSDDACPKRNGNAVDDDRPPQDHAYQLHQCNHSEYQHSNETERLHIGPPANCGPTPPSVGDGGKLDSLVYGAYPF